MVVSKIFSRDTAIDNHQPFRCKGIKVIEKYTHIGKIVFPLRYSNAKGKRRLFITEIVYVHVSRCRELEICRSSLNKAERGCAMCIKLPGSF